MGTIVRRQPVEDALAEIKHPLSAIVANAAAARRWLSRTDPSFHEALAALDRIVKEAPASIRRLSTSRFVGGKTRNQFVAGPSGISCRLRRSE